MRAGEAAIACKCVGPVFYGQRAWLLGDSGQRVTSDYLIAACAAANLAIGTLNGEQET